jgi:uncharacterized membrane protein YfcA
MESLLLLLTGIATGVLAGMLGLGGGIIFTPVLLYIYESQGFAQPHWWAIATSLACTCVTAFSSSIRQYAKGNFDLRRSVLIGLFAIIGILLGRTLVTAPFFSVKVFRIVYAIILGYVALQFTFGRFLKRNKNMQTNEEGCLGWKCALITGSSGGFIATLAGIGGGGVMVPIMHFGFKLPMHKSVSLSSGAIVLIALFGTLGFIGLQPENMPAWSVGYVDLAKAMPLAAGAFLGGFAGVQLSHRLTPNTLSVLFGLVLSAALYNILSGLF